MIHRAAGCVHRNLVVIHAHAVTVRILVRQQTALQHFIWRCTDAWHQIARCERGLLARIHRYTMKSLRNEIKPVTAADYMRFLFDWQGVARPRTPPSVQVRADTVLQADGEHGAHYELLIRMRDEAGQLLDAMRNMVARLTQVEAITSGPAAAGPQAPSIWSARRARGAWRCSKHTASSTFACKSAITAQLRE